MWWKFKNMSTRIKRFFRKVEFILKLIVGIIYCCVMDLFVLCVVVLMIVLKIGLWLMCLLCLLMWCVGLLCDKVLIWMGYGDLLMSEDEDDYVSDINCMLYYI